MSRGLISDNSTNLTLIVDIPPTIYVLIAFSSFICLSIIILNGYFAWITLKKKTFRNVFVVYLVPINVADLSIGFLASWRVLGEVTHNSPYESCFVLTLLSFTSVGTSVTMLLLISVVQYVSIAHPVTHRKVMGMKFAIISSCCVPGILLTFNTVLCSFLYDQSNDTTLCRDINLFKFNYDIVGIFSLLFLCVVLIGITVINGLCIHVLKLKANAISIIEGRRNIEVSKTRVYTQHSVSRQLKIQSLDTSLVPGNMTKSSKDATCAQEDQSGSIQITEFYERGFKTLNRVSHTQSYKRNHTLISQRTRSRDTNCSTTSTSSTNDVTNQIEKGRPFDNLNVSAGRSHSVSTCGSKSNDVNVNGRKEGNEKLLFQSKVKFGSNQLNSRYTRAAIRPIRFKSMNISPGPITRLREKLKLSTEVDRSSRRTSHRSLVKTYLTLTAMSLVALVCLLPYIMRIAWYLLYRDTPEALITFSDFAISANSALNPIIFLFRVSQYKEHMGKLPIRCCCCSQESEIVGRDLT